MSWVRFDDCTPDHPKVAILSDRAFRVMFGAVCYASRFLTDGEIPAAFLRMVPTKVRAELVSAGVWRLEEGVYSIHDYLVYQPSRESVESRRAQTADRVKRFRNRVGNGVTNAPVTMPPSHPLPSPPDPPTTTSSSSEGGARPRGALVTSPLAWHQRHGSHVTGLCDWVCLPGDLADELAGRLPGDREANRVQVEAWARRVREAWQADGRVVGDGSVYEFWKHRWQDEFGSSKPSAGRGGATLRGMAAAVRVDD